MFIHMSWRNIWRNPRRTAVIMTAIIIGVWSMIVLGALMRGIAVEMVRNGIRTLTGHIQVHHRGYRSDPVIENSMSDPRVVEDTLKTALPSGSRWASRVRVNAVASNARHSSGVTFVGIDPDTEANVSFIKDAVIEGRYLRSDDPYGIIVGRALVDTFETKIGHKVVIMSQDTQRDVASRAYRIVGIYKADLEATEKQFVFVTKASAQTMLKMNQNISEISIVLPENADVDKMALSLRGVLPSGEYEVQTWRELLPLVTAYLDLNSGFLIIWYIVVFVAMGFGVVNTTLMAVFERVREFGLLKALGMKPWWIVREVLVESFFILLIGTIIGDIVSYGTVALLSVNGIDLSALAAGSEYFGMSRIIYPAFYGQDVIMANLIVFVLGIIVSLYPAIKAARFTPVEALTQI